MCTLTYTIDRLTNERRLFMMRDKNIAVKRSWYTTKKGLTKKRIVDQAIQTIELHGYAAFSLRNLASALGITVSSLYNHIDGQEELYQLIGLRAVEMLAVREESAVSGKEPEQALYALADACRQFAQEHPELYQIIMGIPNRSNPRLSAAAEQIATPIFHVLTAFGLDEEEQIHYQRALRSVMHGFIAHETGGGFSRTGFDRNISYQIAIRCIISDIQRSKKKACP